VTKPRFVCFAKFVDLIAESTSLFLGVVIALTLLVGHQEDHPACKNWAMRCWCGYLSAARCRLFAYGPADATAIQKPDHLLPDLTKLMHFGPVLGWVTVFGWVSTSVCNQPTRSTQPCILLGLLNRVLCGNLANCYTLVTYFTVLVFTIKNTEPQYLRINVCRSLL